MCLLRRTTERPKIRESEIGEWYRIMCYPELDTSGHLIEHSLEQRSPRGTESIGAHGERSILIYAFRYRAQLRPLPILFRLHKWIVLQIFMNQLYGRLVEHYLLHSIHRCFRLRAHCKPSHSVKWLHGQEQWRHKSIGN